MSSNYISDSNMVDMEIYPDTARPYRTTAGVQQQKKKTPDDFYLE